MFFWQMWEPGREAKTFARTPWREALRLPGAGQVRHARRLIESRPFLSHIPDQSLLLSAPGTGGDHVRATRSSDGSYALVYLPSGKPIRLDLAKLSGGTLNVHWYDPRTGQVRAAGSVPRQGDREFTPPSGGPDWVLVLDDAAKNYPTPGTAHR